MKIIGKMSEPTFCTKKTNYYYGINNDHNLNICSRGKKKGYNIANYIYNLKLPILTTMHYVIILLSGKIILYH